MKQKIHAFTEKIINLSLNNPIFEHLKILYFLILSSHIFYRKTKKEFIFTEKGYVIKDTALSLGFGNPPKLENNKNLLKTKNS